jgi:hypothetical protein
MPTGILDNRQTTFQLTYGGVPFSLDVPEIIQFIEESIPLDDLRETILPENPVSGSIAKNLSGLAIPFHPKRHEWKIGRLFYPTGLTRWGEFHGLMTTTQIKQVEQQLYNSDGSPKLLPFVMRSDVANAKDTLSSGGIQTNMFMLPPRYLGGWGSSKNSGGPSPWDELWLVTLVDDRYAGSYTAAQKIQPDGVMTWDTIIATLAAALGITINPALPAIDAVYGKPSQDSPLWSMYESAAYLLEACAQNVGRSVVRNFDGTYAMPKYIDSGNAVISAPPMTLAGGDMYFSGFAKTRPNLVLPATMTVTFPKFLQNVGYIDTRDPSDKLKQSYGDVWVETVTLSQAGTPWNTLTGKGTRTLHDTARACYTNKTDPTPNNEAVLRNLAIRMVQDYLASLEIAIDIVWPGIRAWVPEGLHDIIWTYRGVPEQASTRVLRKPWNFGTQEFQHTLGCDTGQGGQQCCTATIPITFVGCGAGSSLPNSSSVFSPATFTPYGAGLLVSWASAVDPATGCCVITILPCITLPLPFDSGGGGSGHCCKNSAGNTIFVQGNKSCPPGYVPTALSDCFPSLHCCQCSSGGAFTISQTPCASQGCAEVALENCFNQGPPSGTLRNKYVDSCSITWNNSLAGNIFSITAEWEGFCVSGVPITTPEYPGGDCRFSCPSGPGEAVIPPINQASRIDKLRFNPCNLSVTPTSDSCCTDNNTSGMDINTVGDTNQAYLLDKDCNIWLLCVVDGLVKFFEKV